MWQLVAKCKQVQDSGVGVLKNNFERTTRTLFLSMWRICIVRLEFASEWTDEVAPLALDWLKE
jgi:hypothetical protein